MMVLKPVVPVKHGNYQVAVAYFCLLDHRITMRDLFLFYYSTNQKNVCFRYNRGGKKTSANNSSSGRF